ncbi:MAG: VOC family protein [Saprospiraceae bacterium]|nr:VOC family protein [Saprospiraceae bacterium]
MSLPLISGIQQMGIGIPNVQEAFDWYRKTLKVDIKMFEEAAEAKLMLPYTANQPQSRHAILALSGQGGGGLEIWQYVGRTPQPAAFEIQLGDLGLNINKFKCTDVDKAYADLDAKGVDLLGSVSMNTNGKKHFFAKDPYGNIFEAVESNNWFRRNGDYFGGSYGCIIGVSDMEKSLKFYKEILGYDTILSDDTDHFEDLKPLASGDKKYRRVLLAHSQERQGPFSNMLGQSQIELVQALDRTPQLIFKDRLWGDLGYIHLCFDIKGMPELRDKCAKLGHPFTVDSSAAMDSFDMGEAAGNFAYIEDPDGALIEFVETHKIPIAKKIGWFLDLRKRKPSKALPNWMLKLLAMNRVKD